MRGGCGCLGGELDRSSVPASACLAHALRCTPGQGTYPRSSWTHWFAPASSSMIHRYTIGTYELLRNIDEHTTFCLNQEMKSGLPAPAPSERRVSCSCEVGSLARNLYNFLPRPPHVITRRLDKFHDFRTSFAFYII